MDTLENLVTGFVVQLVIQNLLAAKTGISQIIRPAEKLTFEDRSLKITSGNRKVAGGNKIKSPLEREGFLKSSSYQNKSTGTRIHLKLPVDIFPFNLLPGIHT